jgi:hypothetical protein
VWAPPSSGSLAPVGLAGAESPGRGVHAGYGGPMASRRTGTSSGRLHARRRGARCGGGRLRLLRLCDVACSAATAPDLTYPCVCWALAAWCHCPAANASGRRRPATTTSAFSERLVERYADLAVPLRAPATRPVPTSDPCHEQGWVITIADFHFHFPSLRTYCTTASF